VFAGRLRFDDPATLAGAVALMVASSAVMLVSHNPVVVIAVQVVLAILMVTLGIYLTGQLHDAIPSSVRSSVASGVGTLTWIVFLPFSLVFGFVANRFGVHAGAWLILGAVALIGVFLASDHRHQRAQRADLEGAGHRCDLVGEPVEAHVQAEAQGPAERPEDVVPVVGYDHPGLQARRERPVGGVVELVAGDA
jgi:MFS family permease